MGPGLSRIAWAMFGIGISDAIRRGWGVEATRAEILRRFYECGVVKACVASYGNVTDQENLRDQARTEVVFSAAIMALFVVVCAPFGPIMSRHSASRFQNLEKEVAPHLERLNLRAEANLSRQNVQSAAQDVISRANVQRDPLTRELAKNLG